MTTNSKPTSTASLPTGTGDRKYSKARPLADRLGICPKTLFRWAKAGRINRFVVTRRTVLFAEDEVDAMIRSGRVDGPET